jgi:hypothetical protein
MWSLTAADRGEANGASTTGTSIGVSPTATLDVGDVIVCFVEHAQEGTTGDTTTITVADNSSQAGTANTWTRIKEYNNNLGCVGAVFACVLTRSILATDTVTATWGTTRGKRLIALSEFSAGGGTVTLAPSTGQNATAASTAAPSTRTPASGDLASAEYLWLGGIFSEGGTDVTHTADADYSTLHNFSDGGTAAGNGRMVNAYRITTAVTNDTYNPTFSAARQNVDILVALKVEAVGQTLVPSATSAAGSWTATGAATLHAALSDHSDAAYIELTQANMPSTCRLHLSAGTTPDTGTRTWQCRIGRGGGGSVAFTVTLREGGGDTVGGGTLKGTVTQTVSGAFADFSVAITDAITDYTDLYAEITAATP